MKKKKKQKTDWNHVYNKYQVPTCKYFFMFVIPFDLIFGLDHSEKNEKLNRRLKNKVIKS